MKKQKPNKPSKINQSINDHQSNIADAWCCSEEEKKVILQPSPHLHPSHDNHIVDSQILNNNNFTFDFVDFDNELKNKEDQNLRSEQIYINDRYYNKIFSILCHYSKNLYNSSIYEIRQSQKENFDNNPDGDCSNEQKELRFKISDILKEKSNNYQTDIYKLLDDYFRDTNNENYLGMPSQSAQQTIKLVTDALFSNEQSKLSYKLHPWDYTGIPGDLGYKGDYQSIAILTNQQCSIDIKSKYYTGKLINKFCLTFPKDLRKILKIDTQGTDPIATRFNSRNIDLRHVRIIPLKIGYKIEIVYKKVISEKLERQIEIFNQQSKDRIMGIDIGINNTVAIGCLEIDPENNKPRIIGHHPILIIGKHLKSINQWFNKMTSELYSIYYKQQGFNTKEKGQTVKMGKKFKILSMKRDNFLTDIFHKLSNFVIKYCLSFKIGTIVIDWSKGIKQNMNLGKRINQNFTYIPYSTKLIRMLKYKARQFRIKVIIQNGAYTSLSSFPDNEPFNQSIKNIKDGGLKPDNFGRIYRGLFKTNNNLEINDDIMSSFNQIRKYRIAIGRPIDMNSMNSTELNAKCKPGDYKSNGIVDGMLHPISLNIKRILSEGSRSLVMMLMKKPLENKVTDVNNNLHYRC